MHNPTFENNESVLVYGASTAYGYFAERSGFIDQIRNYMMDEAANGNSRYELANRSRSSQLITHMLGRLSYDITQNFEPGEVKAALIMSGKPDALIRPGESRPRVTVNEFNDTLTLIGETCARNNISCIFIGDYPSNEDLLRPMAANGCYLPEAGYEPYDTSAKEACDRTGAIYIPIKEPILEQYELSEFTSKVDGLHLNQIGHNAIFNLVQPVVRETLYI